MDIKKTSRKIFENGSVDTSIETLYDLLDATTNSETIKKSDIRELIEQLEEHTA